jgi:hypothetical protein
VYFAHILQVFCRFFILRERRKKTTAAEHGKIILYRIKSVMTKRFPELQIEFNNLTDKRKRKDYSMAEIVMGGLFMFIFKETSRNSYDSHRGDVIFAKNYYRQFKLRLPHPDAIDQVMRDLSPKFIEEVKTHLVSSLFEQKILRKFRIN